MLYHMPPLIRRNPRRNDRPHKPFHLCNPFHGKKIGLFSTISFGEVNLYLGDIVLYLEELCLPLGKIGMTGGICLSYVFSLGEVKLSAIFSIEERTYPLEE